MCPIIKNLFALIHDEKEKTKKQKKKFDN